MKRLLGIALAALVSLSMAAPAQAGPFILDLTDADDHGSATATENRDGWLYMQRVLENLAPGVTNGNMRVVQLGGSGKALGAATSAFGFSSLSGGGGWTFSSVNGVSAISDFFDGTGAISVNNTGIIMLDSGFNVSGGMSNAERLELDSNATALDAFLGAGGALHSQRNQTSSGGYGWLSTLVPGLVASSSFASGLILTPAGSAAFPGLSNSDLSAGPYHGVFTGSLGGLTTLFKSTSGRPVGLGSSGGSITNPGGVVPEPGTYALFGLVAAGYAVIRRRRRNVA